MENDSLTQGPIGIFLESPAYSVLEAGKVEIPVVLVNLGEEGSFFEITTEGLPSTWLSLPKPPLVFLDPGESKRFLVQISPTPSAASIAGNYTLTLKITNQSNTAIFKDTRLAIEVKDALEEGRLAILFENNSFSAAPGTRLDIPFVIHNQSDTDGEFELGLAGILPAWIDHLPSPIFLKANERKPLSVKLKLPAVGNTDVGLHHLKLYARNKANPGHMVENALQLEVASFIQHGRISMMMNAQHFRVAPGGHVDIPFTLINNGMEEDTLTIVFDGISRGWYKSPDPLLLRPGEERDLVITLRPPRSPMSAHGKREFSIKVISKFIPNKAVVESKCSLWVEIFAEFETNLSRSYFEAGENVRLTISNQGNAQQPYTVKWKSDQDALVPEVYLPVVAPGQQPAPKQTWQLLEGGHLPLRVPAGRSAFIDFRFKMRKPPLMGKPAEVPFSVEVITADRKARALEGRLTGQPLIPAWMAGIGIFLMVATFLLIMGLFINALANIVSDIELPSLPNYGQTQTYDAAYRTLTAWQGLTLTALVPTNTPTPSLTPPTPATPTSTFTPTATFTATPTATLTTTVIPSTPTFTATPVPVFRGEMLAASNRQNNVVQVYSFTGSAGQTTSRLTFSTGVDESPAWSPDGRKIAFSSNRDGNWEIYVMDANGANALNLTANAASDQHPTWSSDGQWIAFSSNRDGNWEIYAMRSDGTELKNLTNNSAAADTMPAWGNIGALLDKRQVIAFVSNRNGNDDVFIMNIDGTTPVNLSNHPAREAFPTISSEGRIAFVSNRTGDDDIFVMNYDGTSVFNLTTNLASDTHPAFSPDGKEIAYATSRDNNWEIYILSIDGRWNYNLTRDPGQDQYPAWR